MYVRLEPIISVIIGKMSDQNEVFETNLPVKFSAITLTVKFRESFVKNTVPLCINESFDITKIKLNRNI